MLNDFINVYPISASAEHADGSFVVKIKPIEIKGENIGINNEIEKDSLKGKFRLMNGNVYRVINDEPPASDLLKLSEQIDLKDARTNP
ncbi:MAG TPA: hypothetical protein VJI69_06665 [Bacteroidia bacterium]|nr:hypothetical protein [Bacteroidia bacterium]